MNTVHIVPRVGKKVDLRSEDGESTHARLLGAARDLVLEAGPDHISLREVARRVGISAPAVYRHFENKDALIAAACAQGFQVFASYLVRALSERTALGRLRASGRLYLHFGLENQQDYRFIFMSRGVVDAKGGLAEANDEATTFRFLVDRVSECMREKVLRKGDSDVVAATIWAHVHGLVSLRISGHMSYVGDDHAFEEFYVRAVDELLRGLSA